MISERTDIKAKEDFRKIQLKIILVFVGIIFLITSFLVVVILGKSNSSIRKSVSSLIGANSRQLEMNINSYLENVEQTVALLFADEDYYLYDETDDRISDYDKIKMEERILNRIVDLGLMENFSDFFIVYADDYKVGWCSHVTGGMFPDGGMYDTFSSYIENTEKQEGWCWGIKGNTDRMYYAKRLNPNGVLVVSFYNKELDKVFHYPEQLQGLTIRLVNDDNQILFSSEAEEIGAKLPDYVQKLSGTETNASVMDDDYLVNVNTCENGWRVICSISTDIILKENQSIQRFTIIFSLCLGLLFVLAGTLLFRRLAKPMNGMVSSLTKKAYYDQLSGVFNKISFEDIVMKRLGTIQDNHRAVLIMFDVDNFKQINDKLGHARGDQVIVGLGRLLKSVCGENTYIGRLGGDEFAIYKEYHKDDADIRSQIEGDMSRLLELYEKEFEGEAQTCNSSLSIGIYVVEGDDVTFQNMYRCVDCALYYSKRHGKNQYTFYSEEMMENHEENESNEKI